jgi:ELWxxDGT repeat protein
MRASGDDLYFAANDGIHGTELWRVDKDGNAPELVQDLMPGGASSHPQNFQIINGRVGQKPGLLSSAIELTYDFTIACNVV